MSTEPATGATPNLDGHTSSETSSPWVDGGGHQPDELSSDSVAALRAENRILRAKLEHAERLLHSATDYAVITMNLGGRITGWNAGARAILGYAEPEILGRSGEVFFTAEDRAAGVFVGELCRAREHGRALNERWHLRRDGARFWASGSMMPLTDGDGRVEGFLNVFRDDTAGRTEEERRALRLAEMGHRVKNVLATVQAVAGQTLHRAGVSPEVRDVLTARLIALARSHELLTSGDGDGAPLAEVVERALLPYGDAERVTLEGPPVRLPASAVEMLGLAFHELATNAAKYGALSVPEGGVAVRWSLRKGKGGSRFVDILWREHGGPPVIPPPSRGFGSRLLERGLVHDLGGTVKLGFHPEGVECHICLPISVEAD